jgi:hypothetical protein
MPQLSSGKIQHIDMINRYHRRILFFFSPIKHYNRAASKTKDVKRKVETND